MFAFQQFLVAGDYGWTGGEISLSNHRSKVALIRAYRPFSALWHKEWQLHQFTIFGIGALVLFHLAVVAVRKIGGPDLQDKARSVAAAVQVFAGLWLFVPICCLRGKRRRGTEAWNHAGTAVFAGEGSAPFAY